MRRLDADPFEDGMTIELARYGGVWAGNLVMNGDIICSVATPSLTTATDVILAAARRHAAREEGKK